jgi:hypothetical protein
VSSMSGSTRELSHLCGNPFWLFRHRHPLSPVRHAFDGIAALGLEVERRKVESPRDPPRGAMVRRSSRNRSALIWSASNSAASFAVVAWVSAILVLANCRNAPG